MRGTCDYIPPLHWRREVIMAGDDDDDDDDMVKDAKKDTQSMNIPVGHIRTCIETTHNAKRAQIDNFVNDNGRPEAINNAQVDTDSVPVTITPDEYPEQYKQGQFDAAVIYFKNNEIEDDKDAATAFKDLIERVVSLKDCLLDGQCNNDKSGEKPMHDYSKPRLCMIDSLGFANGRIDELRLLCRNSTFIFLFVTDKFIADAYCQMQKDEVVMETIADIDNRWKVIPVISERMQRRMPLGIKALNELSLRRLIRDRNAAEALEGFKDADSVSKLDRYLIPTLQQLFEKKRHLLKRRLECESRALKHWMSKEIEKRKAQRRKEPEEFEDEDARSFANAYVKQGKAVNINIYANAVQVGDHNTQAYSHGAAVPMCTEETASMDVEYILDEDTTDGRQSEHLAGESVQPAADPPTVNTKPVARMPETRRSDDQPTLALPHAGQAIGMDPPPTYKQVYPLNVEDVLRVQHVKRPANRPDVPRRAAPRYLPPRDPFLRGSSMRIVGGRLFNASAITKVQANIFNMREVMKEAEKLQLIT